MRFLVALLALGLLAGCGGGDSGGGEQAAPPAQTMSEGSAAGPELEGTTLDGEQLTLGDFRGRPVLVNVWSSW